MNEHETRCFHAIIHDWFGFIQLNRIVETTNGANDLNNGTLANKKKFVCIVLRNMDYRDWTLSSIIRWSADHCFLPQPDKKLTLILAGITQRKKLATKFIGHLIVLFLVQYHKNHYSHPVGCVLLLVDVSVFLDNRCIWNTRKERICVWLFGCVVRITARSRDKICIPIHDTRTTSSITQQSSTNDSSANDGSLSITSNHVGTLQSCVLCICLSIVDCTVLENLTTK